MTKWPKNVPPLTPEQQRISDDFMKYWHEVLPRRFGMIEKFNQRYVVKFAPRDFSRTLEIGAGLGEHLQYEHLTEEQRRHYVTLELRENMASMMKERYPDIASYVGDCQKRTDFPDGYFDRILAIHVLEHLPDLPAAVREIHRLLDKKRGVLSAVIPCEGGFAYSIARRISAQRIFERRYKQSYRWLIDREHINRPREIIEELTPHFRIMHQSYFPLPAPIVMLNLCIGMTLRPTV
ncbi:MAG TPA: class I SAM-dependent methyltransferase [Nitrospirota bacterium]|nr:class I SAM-dependent methyltransferase [Nitrospirota bacterium]